MPRGSLGLFAGLLQDPHRHRPVPLAFGQEWFGGAELGGEGLAAAHRNGSAESGLKISRGLSTDTFQNLALLSRFHREDLAWWTRFVLRWESGDQRVDERFR